ncbi:MAG: sporulation transcriptional regulator SpoIIID [Ruminococcus sp.]|uniref:sporulation transcriptional regulator SpoIIID n=1 Tax=Ruminococcus sp. TaxID=41978 RepID=UPI002873ACA7|nr:sporulation transcriptional regulator SpoIIID [Ruminococcus sp.]MBQ3284861.1 sporulation transcriptional regulator SpoIIID [Ruminococcus sp.]
MKGTVEERAVRLGEYMIEHQSTVRDTAAVFGISKSTVHKDVTAVLPKLNAGLYKEVRELLDVNKEERHLRGGQATKQKYELQRKRKQKENGFALT